MLSTPLSPAPGARTSCTRQTVPTRKVSSYLKILHSKRLLNPPASITRHLGMRSILGVCEQFSNEPDAKRASPSNRKRITIAILRLVEVWECGAYLGMCAIHKQARRQKSIVRRLPPPYSFMSYICITPCNKPESSVTRSEFTTLIVRYCNLFSSSLSTEKYTIFLTKSNFAV